MVLFARVEGFRCPGFNFLYDDGTNQPFRFKREERADKSRYEVPELHSNLMYDLLPDRTPEGFRRIGLTGPDEWAVFAVDDFDPYEDRFGPADAGQEGQDLVVSSLDPARVSAWAVRWLRTLSSADQEEREKRLPLQHGQTPGVLEDLDHLIRQSECAREHGVLLRLHYSW